MRCKICDLTHKNSKRYESLYEMQLCRECSQTIEIFSWNGNYLQEYWRFGN